MTEPESEMPHPDDDMVTILKKFIAGVQSGKITAGTLRVMHKDGTEETIQFGYTTNEERDAALAKLLKTLGQLH